jgi:multiple sugar transport system substrate-binding protein
VSEDGLKASGYLDTPEAIQGMKNYQRLFTSKLAPPAAMPNQFVAGTGAIHFTGLNLASRLFGANPGFKWGMSPMPRGRTVFNCNSSDTPIVWSKTPYPAEAAALVAFLCNDANRLAFYKTWGSMPVRKSLISKIPEFASQQLFQLSAATAAAGHGAPRTVGWFDYFNAINPVVRDIALGADPEGRLKQAATRIDGLLRKYR